jgi:hypothetical protein
MIRKLSTGRYRLYSHDVSPVTGRPRAVGTFRTRAAAEKCARRTQPGTAGAHPYADWLRSP